MTRAAAVSARELTRRFDDFVAVDRVSFEVGRGEIFGFLGPNGAGKTTTIKMLAGLLLPSDGTGTVAGFDLLTQAEALKEHVGYMSQLFSLYGDLRVEENIAFFSGLYGVPRARRAERRDWVLRMAGLAAQRRRLTGDLPLGYKQRLALGCAVLHEPPILFLDEPTSGVDPITRRHFWDLIDALAQGGTTVFVSTHHLEEAEFCHRLALMNRGRIIALDTPAGLRSAIEEPILELRASDAMGALAALGHAPGVQDVSLFGRGLHARVDDADAARRSFPGLLSEAGVTLESIRDVRPTLEDVFIALVHRAGGAVEG